MTKIVSRLHRERRTRTGQPIHIPHSSWTRGNRADEAATPVNPDEFWSRLGL